MNSHVEECNMLIEECQRVTTEGLTTSPSDASFYLKQFGDTLSRISEEF
jgi:hypothetical protein